MLIFYLFILVSCVWGLKINKNGFFAGYLARSQTSAIKGIFLLLVFASHICGYLQRFQVSYGQVERIPIYFNAWLGQLIVVMFFFYSGLGIMEQFKKIGAEYVRSFPIKRVANVFVNFSIAVMLFLLYNIFFGSVDSIPKIILSFIGWETIGNSNWYIFVILVCYILVYIGLRLCVKHIELFVFSSVIAAAVVISCFKPTWWYDTMLAFSFGIMYAVHRNHIENLVHRHYTWMLAICVVAFLCVRYMPISYIGLKHNVLSMTFATIVVLLTMKISIGNKVLIWIGANLFPLYVYQRLPMLAFEKSLGVEYIRHHATMYVALCAVVTALFALLYQYIKVDLTRSVQKIG